MKKILTVYTGGTIGTAAGGGGRELSAASRYLLAEAFACGASRYAAMADELFLPSGFPLEMQTLSESMTPEKLWKIIEHIKAKGTENYLGVIVMHGTDTLAFSAAVFSVVFHAVGVPIMLVSANRPPSDSMTNAHDNFRAAVELIMSGIAPGVYVPYKNSDGNIYLHFGSSIMQSAVFSEDFYSISESRMPKITLGGDNAEVLGAAKAASEARKLDTGADIQALSSLSGRVMLIHPYTGLDYSRLNLDGLDAVLHTTYHSGTVCTERSRKGEGYSTLSALYLADRCKEAGIPLFIAPTSLGTDQYSTMYDLYEHAKPVYLNMSYEMAYAKLLVGTSLGLFGEGLTRFVSSDLIGEIL